MEFFQVFLSITSQKQKAEFHLEVTFIYYYNYCTYYYKRAVQII